MKDQKLVIYDDETYTGRVYTTAYTDEQAREAARRCGRKSGRRKVRTVLAAGRGARR